MPPTRTRAKAGNNSTLTKTNSTRGKRKAADSEAASDVAAAPAPDPPAPAPPTARVPLSKTKRTLQQSQTTEADSSTPASATKRPKIDKDKSVLAASAAAAAAAAAPSFPPGQLYVFGSNPFGQLGFECEQRKFPAVIPALGDIKVATVACGAIHTLVLTEEGKLYSFGCNDDGALGRQTEEEEDAIKPGLVTIPGDAKVRQISAGDSHSLALTELGEIYVWGTYKNDGNFGLVPGEQKVFFKPQLLTLPRNSIVLKICSGDNHVALLTAQGEVLTAGSERELLGRSYRALRNNNEFDDLLLPKAIMIGNRAKIIDVWTGGKSTICKGKNGDFWGFGLNTTKILGINEIKPAMIEVPQRSPLLSELKFKDLAMGNFHALGLTYDGKIYSWGKYTDGALGIPDVKEDIAKPTIIPRLSTQTIVSVGAGSTVSYAINNLGQVYTFGFGVNYQLGQGPDDDQPEPVLLKTKITRPGDEPVFASRVSYIIGGSMHVALIGVKDLNVPQAQPASEP